MKKLLKTLFSLKITAILLALVAVVLALTTFMENDYGAQYARETVYASWWFEVLLFLLAINLLGAFFRYKLYQKEFWSRGSFHLAFLFILAGGFFTKHFAVEGIMHIREGSCSSAILMDKRSLELKVATADTICSKAYETTLKEFYKVDHLNVKGTDPYRVAIYHYPVAQVPVINELESGAPVLTVLFASLQRSFPLGLSQGQSMIIDGTEIGFNTERNSGVRFLFHQDTLSLIADEDLTIRQMMEEEGGTLLKKGERHPLNLFTIYETDSYRFVLTDFSPTGVIRYEERQRGAEEEAYPEMLVVVQTQGNSLFFPVPQTDMVMEKNTLTYKDLTLQASWQPAYDVLPFHLCLNDFQIERYPGSHSPSEYRSKVTLTDSLDNRSFPFEIYMNNILKYKGYRFFQSSFDQDEKGTVLSVRKDRVGTLLTYMGYLLMILGMIWAVIDRKSRFRGRLKSLSTSKSMKILLLSLFLANGVGALASEMPGAAPKELAAQFGELQLLGPNGRLMPLHTLSDEVLRTLHGRSKYNGLNSDQVMLSMLANPDRWMGEKLFKIKYKALRKRLGLSGSYASFNDIIDPQTGMYILNNDIKQAYSKKPAFRSRYEREVIKIDDRLNVFYLIITHRYLKLFPVLQEGEERTTWVASKHELTGLSTADSLFLATTEEGLSSAIATENMEGTQQILRKIASFQAQNAPNDLIKDHKIRAEILSNKLDLFNRLWYFYSLIGFLMIIIFIIHVANPLKRYPQISKIALTLLGSAFIIHTAGLILRWYISGHAPWSNGYESLVFMAWSAMLAGFIFYKREPFALWATSILTAMVLLVAHLSWMNPQISNLVPVLKSIWLTIHVSVITSSYGFLGLSAIIGLSAINLQVSTIFSDHKRTEEAIRRLTTISEVIMIPGLYLLTIGTFLGAIWANVSWGRYWGWDPKETWALITILVYAFVVHTRYIPGLKSRYLFNVLSVVAFFSILMTYFGVNYYLSGLHSYAGGDPIPIPLWLYLVVGFLMLLFIVGNFAYRHSAHKK